MEATERLLNMKSIPKMSLPVGGIVSLERGGSLALQVLEGKLPRHMKQRP